MMLDLVSVAVMRPLVRLAMAVTVTGWAQLVVAGALFFVEYGGHTILRLAADGTTAKVWERPGCGPSALARAGQDFLVTCYDENALVLVSATGET